MIQTASQIPPTRSREVQVSGLVEPAKAWYVASQTERHPHLLVVCPGRKQAEILHHNLEFFVNSENLYYLPPWDTLPFEPVAPQLHVSAARIKTLLEIVSRPRFILVCSIESLRQRFIPLHSLSSLVLSLSPGQTIDRDDLIVKLDRCGFVRTPRVEELGHYALRGGVIDIFPSTSSRPIRLDIFDDEIESIRTFEEDSQRSSTMESLSELSILPLRERVPLEGKALSDGIERLKERALELEVPPREVSRYAEFLTNNINFPEWELLHALILPELSTLLEVLPASVSVVHSDHFGIIQRNDSFSDLLEERYERLLEAGHLLPRTDSLYEDGKTLYEQLQSHSSIVFNKLSLRDPEEDAPARLGSSESLYHTSTHTELSVKLKAQMVHGTAMQHLASKVRWWREEGFSVAFLSGSESRENKLHALLHEVGLEPHLLSEPPSQWVFDKHRLPLVTLRGELSHGFLIEEEKLVFLAEQDVFSERSHRRKKRKAASVRRVLSTLAQLSEGDFVVHVDYGIGIYQGLRHIEVEGNTTDFLHIEYADSTLYLPAHNIGQIHKFSAADNQTPVVDKLSSTRWKKTKAKVRASVAALAGELIKLYAQRNVVKGWRFEPIGAQDEEFAETFPYDETPDQQTAIIDTLTDMASEQPMDRLVCGDVGFGKTEVAIRAAYKCLQHSRQVAVLVPTTILVEQHRRSFQQRFSGYPYRIESLSRLHQGREARRILEDLASGDIDIIIGTHKLLSKEVSFRDLGLIIIDEEHRFGVKQKEHLKRARTSADVLTLTATPIPRTLHMSLLGIRDISVIETPPPDRRVIRTYVAERDPFLIRDAILRELQRGGQCFYLHNKVQNIEAVTAELKELVPEARVIYAHGQMSEKQVERLMKSFFLHEADVLVSTTIIESGIDVPNANTMIINNAHAFGLAQLYQLRGRVGRSNRQAYTYFLIPRAKKLTFEAQQRLKVLQSLDELGVGFHLAVRDMEIRGAGNLLGGEQSGNVLAVGFELYTKILRDAIQNLRGEEPDIFEVVDPEIKLSVSAFIPDSYVPDISERLLLYQRLASFSVPDEANDMLEELEDRFGPPPPEVTDLIEVMRIKALIRHFGVISLERRPDKLLLSFSSQAPLDIDKLLLLGANFPRKYRLGRNLTLTRFMDENEDETVPQLFEMIHELLLMIRRQDELTPNSEVEEAKRQ